MARKPAATAAVALNMAALAHIVAAGENGTFGPMVEIKPLAEAGLVEVNEGNTDENGNVAVRATAAGIAKASEQPTETPVTSNKSNFEIAEVPADILTVANEKRRSSRGGGEKYPFDALEVGKGFFVPATEKMPEPSKSLASTVSSATARYAEETGETETKVVKTYATGEDGKRIKDDEGHFVVESEAEQEVPVMRNTRVFKVVPAENGAWVVRTA